MDMVARIPRSERMTHGRFAALRQLLGLSPEELAQELNVDPRTVRGWAGGDAPIPPAIEAKLQDILERQAHTAAAILDTGEPIVLPTQARRRPPGWILGIAARVLLQDPDHEVRWEWELSPVAAQLEDLLHGVGITDVVRTGKPTSVTVQIPSVRFRVRHRLTRGEIIDAAPPQKQPHLIELLNTWHDGDRDSRDVSEIRLQADSTGCSWQEWLEKGAKECGPDWQPEAVLLQPETQQVVWAY